MGWGLCKCTGQESTTSVVVTSYLPLPGLWNSRGCRWWCWCNTCTSPGPELPPQSTWARRFPWRSGLWTVRSFPWSACLGVTAGPCCCRRSGPCVLDPFGSSGWPDPHQAESCSVRCSFDGQRRPLKHDGKKQMSEPRDWTAAAQFCHSWRQPASPRSTHCPPPPHDTGAFSYFWKSSRTSSLMSALLSSLCPDWQRAAEKFVAPTENSWTFKLENTRWGWEGWRSGWHLVGGCFMVGLRKVQ